MTHASEALVAPQWQPTERDIADARVTDFARFVQQRTGAPMADYRSLWQWSVDDPAAFWGALWDYFDLGDPPDSVLDNAGDAGGAVVPRRAPELRRPDRAQCAYRPAGDPAMSARTADEATELSWRRIARAALPHSRRRCDRTE